MESAGPRNRGGNAARHVVCADFNESSAHVLEGVISVRELALFEHHDRVAAHELAVNID